MGQYRQTSLLSVIHRGDNFTKYAHSTQRRQEPKLLHALSVLLSGGILPQ